MQTIPIVMSLNQAYVVPAIATIRSVLNSISDRNRIEFVIFHKELSPAAIRIMTTLVNDSGGRITFINVQEHFAGHNLKKEEMYHALLIPGLMAGHDFVFFLDADMIVTGDLLSLIHAMPADKKIGAVRCFFRNTILPPNVPRPLHDQTLRTGLKDTSRYFNAGLMLFNMKAIRPEDGRRCLQLISRRWKGHAESILNVVFHDSVQFFSVRWNYAMTHIAKDVVPFQPEIRKDVEESRLDIQVQHFLFLSKPWLPKAEHALFLKEGDCPEFRYHVQNYKNALAAVMKDISHVAPRLLCGASWEMTERHLDPEGKSLLA
ncbi:hypothetical protein GM609_07355 [Bombella sp. ESL0387]|nr:hypothetical protein [Bombella sp. ESL0387]